MQVIMSLLLRRRAKALIAKRATILDPWFVCLLSNLHEDFMKSSEKENYLWGSTLKAYVKGKSTGKFMKSEFLSAVDVVYVPMNWGSCHWVGLVINLKRRSVEILDSWPECTPEESVGSLISPVIDCIPWLIKRFAPPELHSSLPTTPFSWERVPGLYNSGGSGDCGPVSAKFLEMHAHGLGFPDMALLTNDVVAVIRKAYAMDTYAEFVESVADD